MELRVWMREECGPVGNGLATVGEVVWTKLDFGPRKKFTFRQFGVKIKFWTI